MKSTTILTLYLGLFLLSFFIRWLLSILNINASLKGGEVPGAFAGVIDNDAFQRGTKYTLRKENFSLKTSLYNHIILLLVVISGVLGWGDRALGALPLSPFLQGFLFLLGSAGVLFVLELPSTLYFRFVIEEEFGFNTMGASLFFKDVMKQLLMGGIFLLIFLGGIYGLSAWTGDWWWLAGWGFFIGFQLLLVLLYPLLIAPLFNKFTPLPEGPLKERLLALAEKTRFGNQGLYVMDGSTRSRHGNAYFTGLGRFRRIVLFDTLIDSMEDQEIEAVLAHEIGHAKGRHVVKHLLAGAFLSLGGFALMAWALKNPVFFEAFGFAGASLHGLLFFAAYLSGPLTFFAGPLGKGWSRKHEYQADRYAADNTGGPEAMKAALVKLGKDNLSNLSPHPAYSFWYYSHPAPQERLEALSPAPRESGPTR